MKTALTAAVVSAVVVAASGTSATIPVTSKRIKDGTIQTSVRVPSPRTLVSSATTIEDFDQTENSIAWFTGRRCPRLHMKRLGARRVVTVRGVGCGRYQYRNQGSLVVGAARALWTVSVETDSTVRSENDWFTASFENGRVRVLPCCEYRHDTENGAQPPSAFPTAGSGTLLVYYSHRDNLGEGGGDELTERAIRRVTDTDTAKLFDFDRPKALDVDGGRIALVQARRCVIRLLSGRMVSSFTFRGSPEEVALDGSTAAVLVRRGSNSRVIALFDASSGKSLANLRVSRHAWYLSAGGGWAVYSEGASIRAFKMRAPAVRLSVRTEQMPIKLSAAGRRVAWAENHRGRGRIRAFTLPS